MQFLSYVLLGLFLLGISIGFLFICAKQFVQGICILLGAVLAAVLGTWISDSGESKEAVLDAERQVTKARSPENTSYPVAPTSSPDVSPVLTLKNYEAGRDVSIQCRGTTGNIKCSPVK